MDVNKTPDQAIAALRESTEAHYDQNAQIVEDARSLLAALDAARGQATVWMHRESEDIEYSKKPWMGAEWQPLYSAPPAAAVLLDGTGYESSDVVRIVREHKARGVVAEPSPAAVVPEGYALVPVEPTPEMVEAGARWGSRRHAAGAWAAMLAAAERKGVES